MQLHFMHVEQTTIDRICCQFWKMRWSILHISTKLNFVVWDDSNTKQMQLWEPFSKNKWKNWIQLIFWPAIYSPFFFFKNKLWIRILQSIENSFLSRYGLGKINLNAPWCHRRIDINEKSLVKAIKSPNLKTSDVNSMRTSILIFFWMECK